MAAQKWRKKPVAVEAMRLEKPYAAVQEFCPELVLVRNGGPGNKIVLGYIDTLEGRMAANLGDYIIRGVQGEFYPCKPDIFLATYEPEEKRSE